MRAGFSLLLPVVVVVGLGIGAGVAAYQSSQPDGSVASASQPTSSLTPNQAASGQAGQLQRNTSTMGVVASVREQEFSLKSESSPTPVVVRLSEQTTIRKQVAGTPSDLKSGDTIAIRGSAQPDGGIAATTVQVMDAQAAIAPVFMQRQGAGQAASQDTQTAPQGQARVQRAQTGMPSGSAQMGTGGQGIVMGTVTDANGNVLSVTRAGPGADGTVLKVTLSDQTSVTKMVAGVMKDIAEGVTVTVLGSAGTDGSITATSIQIQPAGAPSGQ